MWIQCDESSKTQEIQREPNCDGPTTVKSYPVTLLIFKFVKPTLWDIIAQPGQFWNIQAVESLPVGQPIINRLRDICGCLTIKDRSRAAAIRRDRIFLLRHARAVFVRVF